MIDSPAFPPVTQLGKRNRVRLPAGEGPRLAGLHTRMVMAGIVRPKRDFIGLFRA